MKPLLCICDLDETLLNSQKKISEANEKAILTLQRNGTPVTIATGRSHLQDVYKRQPFTPSPRPPWLSVILCMTI